MPFQPEEILVSSAMRYDIPYSNSPGPIAYFVVDGSVVQLIDEVAPFSHNHEIIADGREKKEKAHTIFTPKLST